MAKIDLILEKAQALNDNERFDEAYNLLVENYELGKTNAEFLEKIALAAQTIDKKDEAVKYWEELTEVSPGSLIAYTELQDAYSETNRYKYYMTRAKVKTLNGQVLQAIPDYKKASDNTQDQDEKIQASILMAKAYEYTGKFLNAVDEYYKVASIKADADIYIKIADLYVQEKDKLSAIGVLKTANERFSDDIRIKDFIANLYIETDEPDKAKEFAVADLLKIKIFLMQGKNSEAKGLLENVQDKNNSEYYKLLAEYYFNTEDWENCKSAIAEFGNYEPNHPLYYQMLSLVCEGNNQKHDAHVNRAKMYIAKGEDDIALHEYMQAHYIEPSNIQTIEDIIKICENNGEKHTAAEFYEKLLKLEPNDEKTLIKSGDFYYDMGEYRQASDFYEKAADNTKNPQVFLKTAKCFEKLKREKIAKDYYEKYLAKAPISPETNLIKQKISELSDSDVTEDEGFLEKFLKMFSKK